MGRARSSRARLSRPRRRGCRLSSLPWGLVGELLGAFADLSPDRVVVDDRATLAMARSMLAQEPAATRPSLALHEDGDDIFEHHGVADEVAAALSARVALPGGAALIVET